MELRIKTIVLLLPLSLGLIGCSLLQKKTPPKVVLYPITKSDIFIVEKGSRVISPDGKSSITVDKNGRFLSDFYIEEIMKVKVEE